MLKFVHGLGVLLIIQSVLAAHNQQQEQQQQQEHPTIDSEKLNQDFYGRVRNLLNEKYPNSDGNQINVSDVYNKIFCCWL